MKNSKALTPKQFLKLHPEKYVMVTHQFVEPIYISESKELLGINITDKKENAIQWSALDISDMKLNWHKAKTGYTELVFEIVPFMTMDEIVKVFKTTPEKVRAQYNAGNYILNDTN